MTPVGDKYTQNDMFFFKHLVSWICLFIHCNTSHIDVSKQRNFIQILNEVLSAESAVLVFDVLQFILEWIFIARYK